MLVRDKDQKLYQLTGEIDDAARSAFTRGHCHSLALVAHEQKALPIYLIGDRRGWRHAVTKLNETHYGDIHGIHTESALIKKWERWSGGPAKIEHFSPEDLWAEIHEHSDNPLFGFNEPDLDAARYIWDAAWAMWANELASSK